MLAKIFVLSLFLFVNPVTFIANRNYYATEAEKAFRNQNYALASQHYAYMIQGLEWKNDNIQLNLAHTYFLEKKYTLATVQYVISSQSNNTIIASTALSQLGYMASLNQDFETALSYFQEAISRYIQNKEARYNYELIAKILHKRGKKPKNNQKDIQKEKEKKKDAQQRNGGSKTENKLNPQKLKDLQFNKEKAEAILKALQNQEMQYIQQQQQKKKLQNAPPNSLPDW